MWRQSTTPPLPLFPRSLSPGQTRMHEDRNGWTPLHSAARYNAVPAIATVLAEAGADPNGWTNVHAEDGVTPLYLAVVGQDVAVVAGLIKAGADASIRNKNGWTPMHQVARYSDNPAIVAALVDAGADLDARTEDGWSALHIAAALGKVMTMIAALVDAGADPNAPGGNGWTPLHAAASQGEVPDMIIALLDAGADPTIRDDYGRTPWNAAQSNGALRDTEAWSRLEAAALARLRRLEYTCIFQSRSRKAYPRLYRCGGEPQCARRQCADAFAFRIGWSKSWGCHHPY